MFLIDIFFILKVHQLVLCTRQVKILVLQGGKLQIQAKLFPMIKVQQQYLYLVIFNLKSKTNITW